MPRRKPAPCTCEIAPDGRPACLGSCARKSRSGTTLPESARVGTRMHLRLDPDETIALDALTRRWGCVRSHAIARAIRDALEREPPTA